MQPSEQDVHVEEFFWTGSGDGPVYTKPKSSGNDQTHHGNTFIRTATILVTVYKDGTNDFDTSCDGYECDEKVCDLHMF